MLEINKIHQGDCLELMRLIEDKTVDMILCDLPYGTTDCKWDIIIPFDKLWEQYERIIKENGAIVLTARQPFTSKLLMSNIRIFKHSLVWNKKQAGAFMNAKFMPLQITEDILIFSKGKVNYFPIMRKGKFRKRGGNKKIPKIVNHSGLKEGYYNYSDKYYPTNIIEIVNKRNGTHPTQKPVALFGYLIKTYSKEGDLVLDNCAGSFTTAIASENLKRNWICIEKEEKYCDIGQKRIEENRLGD